MVAVNIKIVLCIEGVILLRVRGLIVFVNEVEEFEKRP